MKKYIFTESQIKKIIDNQINEQLTPKSGKKFPFAFENSKTTLEGEIKKDGYLYASSEMNTHKIGPLAKVPFVGKCEVIISDNKGQQKLFINGKPAELAVNFTVDGK